jgi:plastocyanin
MQHTSVSRGSAKSAGAKAICMRLQTIPPGARAKALFHAKHETAIYVLGGTAETCYEGDCASIWSYMPAIPYIAGDRETNGRSPTVAIQTFQFRPTPSEVEAGTRITWNNQDDILHTVTSGTPDNRDNRFGAPLDGKGTSYSFTFTQGGAYPYFCERHQSMRGEILVR